jgi:hypothetical protein
MSYSGQRTRWGTFYRVAKEVERTRGRRSPTAWWTFTPDIFEAEEGGGGGRWGGTDSMGKRKGGRAALRFNPIRARKGERR